MSWWKNPRYDITGKRFGKLKALWPIKKSGRRMWRCICDCGGDPIVSAHNLRSRRSNGCERCKGRLRPYEWLFRKLIRSAAKRRVSCSLTYQQFVTLIQVSHCHYCNIPIAWEPFSRWGKRGSQSYSLDRKNNRRGYTRHNCVVCCVRCNLSKGDRFTYREWVEIGRVIRQWGATRGD